MKLLLFVLLLPIVSFSQSGSIKGNVFYNSGYGQKPDAGSEIVLLSDNNPSFRQEAIADIQGNYAFNNLDTGRYLLISRSYNTFYRSPIFLDNLKRFSDHLDLYCPGFSKLFDTPLYDSIMQANKEYYSLRTAGKINKSIKIREQSDKLCERFFKNIPQAFTDKLSLISSNANTLFRPMIIEAKENTVVTNFGKSLL